jgi:hypothetical protein
MKTYRFTLCRSDQGDGGWSLHPPQHSDEDHMLVLASGSADLVDDQWTRPNQTDYDAALAEYRKSALSDQLVRAQQ